MASFSIREAARSDTPILLGLIRELAAYEKLLDAVTADEATLTRTLFGERPYAHALIVETEGKPVGYGIYFFNFSTFLGKPGLYVEDIYVTPDQRGYGIGKALFRAMAKIAQSHDCGRMEWTVLDWNKPSIDFYEKSLHAEPQKEWIIERLTASGIAALANA